MRVSFLLELILAIGVGLGIARYRMSSPVMTEAFSNQNWVGWSEQAIDGVLAGMALVLGAGTWVERLRGRSPDVWGPGRWIWASLAIFLPLKEIGAIVDTVAARLSSVHSDSLAAEIIMIFQGEDEGLLILVVPSLLVALGVTWFLAPSRRDSKPDARDWSGRAFAMLIVLSAISFKTLSLLGFTSRGGMGGGM